MPINLKCDGCNKQYRVADQSAGKKLKCKNCGKVLIVPLPQVDPAATKFGGEISLADMERDEPPVSKPAARAAPAARPAPTRTRPAPPPPPTDDFSDAAPPGRESDQSGGPNAFLAAIHRRLPRNVWVWGAAVVLLLLIVAYFTASPPNQTRSASATTQPRKSLTTAAPTGASTSQPTARAPLAASVATRPAEVLVAAASPPSLPPAIVPSTQPQAMPTTAPGDATGSKVFSEQPASTPSDHATAPPIMRPRDANDANRGNDAANPSAPKPPETLAGMIRAAECSLVAEVIEPELGDLPDDLIHGALPSKWMVVVRRGKEGDENAVETVERWSINPFELHGKATFKPDSNVGTTRYGLSPDGSKILRVVSWPKLAADTLTFDTTAVTRSIDLNDKFGKPSAAGFIGPDKFVIRWEKSADQGIEVWDSKTGQRGKQYLLPIPKGVEGGVVYAFSPDGRWLAVVGKIKEKNKIMLLDLPGASGNRQFPITGIEDNAGGNPAGLAFAPDGKRVTAVYEHDGDALVLTWRTLDGKQLEPWTIHDAFKRPVNHAAARPGSNVRGVDYIVNGRGLLLGGNSIINPDTGELLGQLGVDTVDCQWVDPSGNACLGWEKEHHRGVVYVKFAADKFPAPPSTAPVKPPAP